MPKLAKTAVVSGPPAAMAGETPRDASDSVRALIDHERVRALYRQMPTTFAATLIVMALTVGVLKDESDPALIWSWATLIALVTLLRLIGWRIYQQSAGMVQETRAWARFSVTGSLASGLLWGIGCALLFPGSERHQLFLTFVVGGMCAGAVTVNSSYFPSLAAFVLPAAAPLSARFLVNADKFHAAMAGMMLIFAVVLMLIARRFNTYFVEMAGLQLELAERSRALDKTNDSLRQAQKLEAIGRLTGGIAHDFNNVLTAVIGFVSVAIRRLDKDVGIRPLLENALRSADRGAMLTQRLLAFARKQHLNPKPVNLETLITGIKILLEQAIGPEIGMRVEFGVDPVAALVDMSQLELAIVNLAINARDAMPDGGTLGIEVAHRFADGVTPPGLPPGDYAVVSIIDNGAGMDAETLANAFEPFFTTKEVGAGSGLGLSMVQGFAAQSGGTVTLGSRLGEGTRADIWLPRAEISPFADASSAAPHRASAKARILLCDDDEDARRAIAEILRGDGHVVREVEGATPALEILGDGQEIDILITDYAMPGMNGALLLAEALKRRPHLKTLLISGHPAALRDEDRRGSVLAKPFTPTGLARRIAELQNTR